MDGAMIKTYDNNLIDRLENLADINTEIEYFIKNKKWSALCFKIKMYVS